MYFNTSLAYKQLFLTRAVNIEPLYSHGCNLVLNLRRLGRNGRVGPRVIRRVVRDHGRHVAVVRQRTAAHAAQHVALRRQIQRNNLVEHPTCPVSDIYLLDVTGRREAGQLAKAAPPGGILLGDRRRDAVVGGSIGIGPEVLSGDRQVEADPCC